MELIPKGTGLVAVSGSLFVDAPMGAGEVVAATFNADAVALAVLSEQVTSSRHISPFELAP